MVDVWEEYANERANEIANEIANEKVAEQNKETIIKMLRENIDIATIVRILPSFSYDDILKIKHEHLLNA